VVTFVEQSQLVSPPSSTQANWQWLVLICILQPTFPTDSVVAFPCLLPMPSFCACLFIVSSLLSFVYIFLPVSVGAILTANAKNESMFLAGRWMTGVGSGCAGASAKSYLAEITPPASRGAYMGFLNSLYVSDFIVMSHLWLIAQTRTATTLVKWLRRV